MFVPRLLNRFVLIDYRHSLPLDRVIQSCSRVAMAMGFLPRHKHLQVTGQGQKRVTSIDRVLVLQENAIVGIVYSLCGKLLQRFERLSPLIMVGNSSPSY